MTEEERRTNGSGHGARPWLVTSPLTEYIEAMSVSADVPGKLLAIINAFRAKRAMFILSTSSASDLYSSALVHVRVNMLGRGSLEDMAVLYALSRDERGAWLQAHGLDRASGRARHELSSGDSEISEAQRVRIPCTIALWVLTSGLARRGTASAGRHDRLCHDR